MKTSSGVLFGLVDLTFIAELLQQNGVKVPTSLEEVIKLVLGVLLYLYFAYRREKALKQAVETASCKAVEKHVATQTAMDSGAAGGAGGGADTQPDSSDVHL